MKDYFFFNVFRRTLIQFLDAFNNIKIARYSEDGSTIDRLIEVPVKHSIKEKVYYWLNERKDDEMLPMITAYVNSIDWDTNRTVNGFYQFCTGDDTDETVVKTYLHPCPYNLGITMNIWALHFVDMDQIIEQILPFFCPNIFIRVNLEEIDVSYDVKVIFRSATPEVSHEIADMEYRVLSYSLDFEAQAWFFKPISDTGLIKKIYGSFFPDGGAFGDYLASGGTFSSGASGGLTFELKGKIEDGEKLVRYTLFEP
jgi:hypothetical protein